MKMRLFSLLLVIVLAVAALTGCQTGQKAKSAGSAIEQDVQSAGNALKKSAETTTAPTSGKHTKPALTLEEAQSIALKHAGFSTDQVTALHAEYEVEHGIPQYDVEFHHGAVEYDYEIHADTGEVLSYSKDN